MFSISLSKILPSPECQEVEKHKKNIQSHEQHEFNLDNELFISGKNTEIIQGKEIGEQCSARQANAYHEKHP